MWITAASGQTNRDAFLYDIENRRVLGQLANGWAAMVLGDPHRLLCSQSIPVPLWNRIEERALKLIAQISGGRTRLPKPQTESVSYWLLDLEKHAPQWLGNIPGTPNLFLPIAPVSMWMFWRLGNMSETPNFSLVPSPDFHYCFTGRFARGTSHDFYLLDLQADLIRKMNVPSWPCDWWDNTHLLVRTTNGDFVLYDVRNKAVSPLISSGKIAAFFMESGLSDKPAQARLFATWNGRENDFYLTDSNQKWLAAESFLIKLERPDGRLKLVSQRFKFEWSDHFDQTGRHYLYSGREAGNASDGVFLRDLDTGINRVLVPSASDEYYSIPRFYRDSVIYVRSNALWKIGLDGSNNVRVFPP